jgi:sec-independent protein translocase protein TatA
MFGFHGIEIVIFLLIVLLLFGKKLPGAARSLGMSFIEFKKGVQGVDEDQKKDDRDASTTDRPASTPSALKEKRLCGIQLFARSE